MDKAAKAHLPADKAVVAVFTNKESAERAYGLLKEMGYPENQINVLMSDQTRLLYYNAPHMDADIVGNDVHSKPAAAAAVGAGAGALIGAGLATAVTIGTGVLVAGPLALLLGVGMGGLTGGLAGSLVGIGVPETEAEHYESKAHQQGNVILGVNPRNAEEQRTILDRWSTYGGELAVQ